jgi:hypothetical protein
MLPLCSWHKTVITNCWFGVLTMLHHPPLVLLELIRQRKMVISSTETMVSWVFRLEMEVKMIVVVRIPLLQLLRKSSFVVVKNFILAKDPWTLTLTLGTGQNLCLWKTKTMTTREKIVTTLMPCYSTAICKWAMVRYGPCPNRLSLLKHNIMMRIFPVHFHVLPAAIMDTGVIPWIPSQGMIEELTVIQLKAELGRRNLGKTWNKNTLKEYFWDWTKEQQALVNADNNEDAEDDDDDDWTWRLNCTRKLRNMDPR